MVDVDVNEYLKIKNHIDLMVNCDVKDFIRYVIKKDMPQIVVSDEWKNYCDRLYMEFSPYEGKVTMNMEGRVNKYYFGKNSYKLCQKQQR